MRRIFYGWILSGALFLALPIQAHEQAAPDTTGIQIGNTAPAFQAKSDSGKLWKSEDHIGKSIVIVYFFPAALTGG